MKRDRTRDYRVVEVGTAPSTADHPRHVISRHASRSAAERRKPAAISYAIGYRVECYHRTGAHAWTWREVEDL